MHAADLATTLGGLGSVYRELGQDQEALQYLDEALTTAHAEEQDGTKAAQLTKISMLYADLGQPQQSLDYLNQIR